MSKKNKISKQRSTCEEVPFSTYQTRLKNQPDAISGALDDCADLLSRVERQLFAQSQKVDTFKGKVFNQIKSFFLSFFGILSRHFNSINFSLQGKVDSYRFNLDRHIKENKERVDKARQTIEKLSKKTIEPNQRQKHLNNIHLSFGSKKMFNAQFDLKANGYENIEQWKSYWQKARRNQFILVGSKDETAGNQLCVAKAQKDGSLTLRVRMPNALVPKHGKYVEIHGVKFEYGQDVIDATLNDNEARRVLKSLKSSETKRYGQAITYRFLRDKKGWRVFVSLARPQIPIKTFG